MTALLLLEGEPNLARLLYFASLELSPYERRAIYDNHIKPVVTALLIRLRAWMQIGDIRQMDPETAALGILGTLLLQLQFQLLDPTLGKEKAFERRSAECIDLCLRGFQNS
ncbi:MAG TPA: hypothetical protein VFU48_11940 [Nitrospira sp.]|nr:hypothetical protein [Nitrospira sp.]